MTRRKKITSTDMTERILSIHNDLEEFSKLIDEKTGKPQHLHPQVDISVFDGSWSARIFPSLINFPFGTAVLKEGVHEKNLELLLDELKKKSSEQLENLKHDLVSTVKI